MSCKTYREFNPIWEKKIAGHTAIFEYQKYKGDVIDLSSF